MTTPSDAVHDPRTNLWWRGTTDASGLKQGAWRAWRADGSLKHVAHYQHGLPHGLFEAFHPSGALAEQVEWHQGQQGNATFTFEPGSDVVRLETYADEVVRVEVSATDGLLRGARYYDAQGREITQGGAPVPPRPDAIAAHAFWVPPRDDLPEGAFMDGGVDPGTQKQCGVQRFYRPSGEPAFESNYDQCGRRLFSVPHTDDPRDALIEAFFAAERDAIDSGTAFALRQHWTPALHDRCLPRLSDASGAHVWAYCDRVASAAKYWGRGGAPLGKHAAAAVARAWLAHGRPEPEAAHLQALVDRLGERRAILGGQSGEALWTDEATDTVWLGKTAADAAPTPLRVNDHPLAISARLRAYDACDARRLSFTGKHIFWVFQRYQTAVLVIGSRFFASRDQSEITTHLLIECPDRAWADRVEKLFVAMRPKSTRKRDEVPFFSPHRGEAFVRAYTRVGEMFSFTSLGVHGCDLISGGRSPGVLRLDMQAGKKTGPTVIETFASHDEAVHAFETREMAILHQGATISRIVPLEVAEPQPVKRRTRKAAKVEVASQAADVSAELGAAVAACSADDVAGAVSALLTAWRARPLPAIAEMIGALSNRATLTARIDGKAKANASAWQALAESWPPQLAHLLFQHLPDVPIKVALTRLDAALPHANDPRFGAAVVRWLRDEVFTSTSSKPFWNKVFAALAEQRDVELAPRLTALVAHGETAWHTQMGGWLRGKLTALATTLTTRCAELGAEATPAEAKALAQLLPANPTLDAAIDAVLARPDDPALRLAVAEADPTSARAEHIRLSFEKKLSKAQKARLACLERSHAHHWAPFAGALDAASLAFHAGFLQAATITSEADAQLSSPWWNTVEALDVSNAYGALTHPGFPHLRAVSGFYLQTKRVQRAPTAAALAERPALTHLEMSRLPTELLSTTVFPALHTIELSYFDREIPEFSGPLWDQLTHLELNWEVTDERRYALVMAWIAAALQARGPKLAKLSGTFRTRSNARVLLNADCTAEGVQLTLTLTRDTWDNHWAVAALPALLDLLGARCTGCTLVPPKSLNADTTAAFERLTASHPKVRLP